MGNVWNAENSFRRQCHGRKQRFLSGFLDSKVTVRLTIVRFEVVPPQITQQNVEKGHRIVSYNEV